MGVAFLDELHASWNEISQTVNHLIQEDMTADDDATRVVVDEEIIIISEPADGDDTQTKNN